LKTVPHFDKFKGYFDKLKDAINFFKYVLSSASAEHVPRRKRAVSDNLNIETVVILDALYVARIRAAGITDNQTIHDLMELKWTGVS
jgi:hypothetical protein